MPKQFSGRSFRDSHGKPALSLARAPLFWRGWPDGLPETNFRAMQSGGILEAAVAHAAQNVATRAAQIIKGKDQASGRNGSFINQKRTNGKISSFGLRMADFILPRIGLAKRMATLSRPASRSGRFSTFYQVLSTTAVLQGQGPGQWPQWPLYSSEAAKFHIATYKEFISGQAEPVLSRAGKAIGRCIKGDGRFIKAGQPQYSFSNSGRFIKARPMAAMAVVSLRSGHMARSLKFGLRMADPIVPYKEPARRSGCFIKANGRFIKVYQHWPLYQG